MNRRILDRLLPWRAAVIVGLALVGAVLPLSGMMGADKTPAKSAPNGGVKISKPGQMSAPAAAAPKKKIDKLAVLAKFRDEMPTHKYAASHTVELLPQELDRMLLSQLG